MEGLEQRLRHELYPLESRPSFDRAGIHRNDIQQTRAIGAAYRGENSEWPYAKCTQAPGPARRAAAQSRRPRPRLRANNSDGNRRPKPKHATGNPVGYDAQIGPSVSCRTAPIDAMSQKVRDRARRVSAFTLTGIKSKRNLAAYGFETWEGKTVRAAPATSWTTPHEPDFRRSRRRFGAREFDGVDAG